MFRIRCILLVLFFLSTSMGCKPVPADSQGQGKEEKAEAPAKLASNADGAKDRKSQAVSAQGRAPDGEVAPLPGIVKQPKIVFDALEFDFGLIEAGEKITHSFTFQNKGDAVLHIDKVGSS